VEQIERTSEKIASLLVFEASGCSHCVQSCLKEELGQTWRAGEVTSRRRRRLRMAQGVVEGVCFLKNWSLYREARKKR